MKKTLLITVLMVGLVTLWFGIDLLQENLKIEVPSRIQVMERTQIWGTWYTIIKVDSQEFIRVGGEALQPLKKN